MSQSARSLSVAVDRAAALATGPQSRHLIFKPCRHLLRRRSFGSRLKQLNRQAIGAPPPAAPFPVAPALAPVLAARRHPRLLSSKPCRPPLARRSFGSRLRQLNRQAIGALALPLKICSVIGCRCFEPRDLRLQCLKPCRRLRARRSFGGRLKALNRHVSSALALAPVTSSGKGCRCFEPPDLRLRCLKRCRQDGTS